MAPVKLESLVQYLDTYLGVADHPDYGPALNGLQVAGTERVQVVATAVDATLASIEAASALGADLLIVHHGLFWDGVGPVSGRRYRRLKALFDADLALYSAHLPLDAHPEVGNCALLADAIGLQQEGRFGRYQGTDIGWWGTLTEPWSAEALQRVVSGVVGGPVRVLSGGPDGIQRVAVLTGGGGSFVEEAAARGMDALVTGEASHHTFFDAAELGVHVLLAGHYATETFGVRALGEHVAERFGVTAHFIDQPTGL
jgi:dinuclear metal center YbgI/SA1388 family protein